MSDWLINRSIAKSILDGTCTQTGNYRISEFPYHFTWLGRREIREDSINAIINKDLAGWIESCSAYGGQFSTRVISEKENPHPKGTAEVKVEWRIKFPCDTLERKMAEIKTEGAFFYKKIRDSEIVKSIAADMIKDPGFMDASLAEWNFSNSGISPEHCEYGATPFVEFARYGYAPLKTRDQKCGLFLALIHEMEKLGEPRSWIEVEGGGLNGEMQFLLAKPISKENDVKKAVLKEW